MLRKIQNYDYHYFIILNFAKSDKTYAYQFETCKKCTILKQELGECIPPPMGKFLAPPNRKSMGQSGSLMIFFVSKL